MKNKLILALCATLLLIPSCTENTRAKALGGTVAVDLPKDTKLITATWKDAQLWYLTRPMREGEVAETLTFKEKSNLGFFDGAVIFKETK